MLNSLPLVSMGTVQRLNMNDDDRHRIRVPTTGWPFFEVSSGAFIVFLSAKGDCRFAPHHQTIGPWKVPGAWPRRSGRNGPGGPFDLMRNLGMPQLERDSRPIPNHCPLHSARMGFNHDSKS